MSRFQLQYPPGSLRYREEILDLLLQTKNEKININLYSVEQMGYMSRFILTPKSSLTKNSVKTLHDNPSFDQIFGYSTYNYSDPSKWLWNYLLLGSYNIPNPKDNGCGVHRLFTHSKLAEKYSLKLKNDKEYIEEVKNHHKMCNELFKDDFWDEYE